jgi:adenylosuccinate lyase
MIERYSLPEMAAVWSEAAKLQRWQRIEVLALEGWEAEGTVPAGAAEAAASAPPIDIEAWRAREAEIHHDLAAFVDVMAGSMESHGEWLHYGLTSSDVLDTALGVALGEASDLLLERVIGLFEALKRQATAHRTTAMLGRTHGIAAEPTTFGHKMAGFTFEFVRIHRRLEEAAHTVRYGTISGPVGNHSTVPPQVERHVVGALGLNAEPAATQVVGRDRHAMFLSTLAVVGSSLERLAIEIRHLSRTEVGEVAEAFAVGQKGSSAMPHKRNPILSENISGLVRLLRGYAVVGMENVALWHERDMSHSSAERVALADACLVLDFALARMTRIVDGLVVDADRMRSNLEASQGLVFSQAVLNALIRSGVSRHEAYRTVQEAATRATEAGTTLRAEIEADSQVALSAADLDGAFDLSTYLQHAGEAVDHLEERVTTEWLRTGGKS